MYVISKTVTITFKDGLHMRPAADLVAACRPFDASSSMVFNGQAINLKSVLGVVGAHVKHGDTIELKCDGPQAAEAMAALASVINSER